MQDMRSTSPRPGVLVALIASTLLTAGCASANDDQPATVEAPATATTAPSPSFSGATPAGTGVPADQVDAARASGLQVYVSPSPDSDGSGVVVRPGEPLPQAYIDDMVFTYTPLDASAMTPSEETINRNTLMTDQVPYRQALAEVDVPYAIVYPGMCLGADPLNPDDPSVEVFDPSQMERLRWDYYKCNLDRWYLAAVHGVDGADTFQADMWGFDSLDAALTSVQPYLDANPGLQLIVAR